MPDAGCDREPRLGRLVDEQAALRRVATLAARGAGPEEIFAAVSDEVARLFAAEAAVGRFEPDGSAVVFVGISRGLRGLSIGTRWKLEGSMAATTVYRTGRAARTDRSGYVPGTVADALRDNDLASIVAAPIMVEGELWGIVAVAGTRERLPADTESRLQQFTELVAIAIAGAESRAELAASERRAGDLAREQAALRRVATLVAEGASEDQLFCAVSEEVGRLFDTDQAAVGRFDPDGRSMVVVGLAEGTRGSSIGARWPLEDFLSSTGVYRTGRPARVEQSDYANEPGAIPDRLREIGLVSDVSAPIVVEGELWGVVGVGDARERLPPDTEDRLARFTELVATAIANRQARESLAQLADEQAALRRVATLVARGVRPEVVFSAVSEEVGRLFGTGQAAVGRFDPDGPWTVFVGVTESIPVSIGTRWPLEDFMASTAVYRTGRPARSEKRDYENESGAVADQLREINLVATVTAPIVVEGELWGSMSVTDMHGVLPPDTEERLETFAELVGTAVANAATRAQLAASRARVIAAGDDARRRIERDLHDGAQQRLVTLALALRRAEAKIPAGLHELRADVARVAEGLKTAVDELRETSRGIHPAVLTEGGLVPALKALGRRSAVRVKLDATFEQRLPDPVEIAAYYTVSESITNASKHAGAGQLWVSMRLEHETLYLSIRDDGVGGADPRRGSGLIGLADRIEALGGKLEVTSPPGTGTLIAAEFPIRIDSSVEAARSAERLLQARTPSHEVTTPATAPE